jgi:hypothetical protein
VAGLKRLTNVSTVETMWGKRRDMTVRDRSPFNAEPPASVLAGAEITALDAFRPRPTPTPHCQAKAFRCRRYLSTATSSFLATTSRSLPAR